MSSPSPENLPNKLPECDAIIQDIMHIETPHLEQMMIAYATAQENYLVAVTEMLKNLDTSTGMLVSQAEDNYVGAFHDVLTEIVESEDEDSRLAMVAGFIISGHNAHQSHFEGDIPSDISAADHTTLVNDLQKGLDTVDDIEELVLIVTDEFEEEIQDRYRYLIGDRVLTEGRFDATTATDDRFADSNQPINATESNIETATHQPQQKNYIRDIGKIAVAVASGVVAAGIFTWRTRKK